MNVARIVLIVVALAAAGLTVFLIRNYLADQTQPPPDQRQAPQIASIDIFNSSGVYCHYFPKLLRGAAFEDRRPQDGEVSEAEAIFKAPDLLDKLDRLDFEEYQSVGAGTDRRSDLNSFHVSQLLFDKQMVHTGIFGGAPDIDR